MMIKMEISLKRTCIIVAGMHRSGTSVLARMLNLLGCDLPTHVLGARHGNEAGHWEPEALLELNDQILESAGSSWDDWAACTPGWFTSPKIDEYKERAIKLFEAEYGNSRLTVFKDPRVCRLLPFWLDALRDANVRPHVILPVRNPLEVAQSLARRDGSDVFYNQLLWLRHILDSETGSRDCSRYFSSYDDVMTSWTKVAKGAEKALNITWPRMSARAGEEIDAFVSDNLRHHKNTAANLENNPNVTDWVRAVYAIMLKWISEGEDKADYRVLDDIRSEFDAAADVFSRLIFRGKEALGEARWLRGELGKYDAERLESDKRADNLQHQFDELVASQADLEARAIQSTVEAARAEAAEQALNAALSELADQKAHAEAAEQTLNVALSELADQKAHAEAAEQTLNAALSELADQKAHAEAAEQTLNAALSELADQKARAEAAEQGLQTLISDHSDTLAQFEAYQSANAEAQKSLEEISRRNLEVEKILTGLQGHLEIITADLQAGELEKQKLELNLRVESALAVQLKSNILELTRSLAISEADAVSHKIAFEELKSQFEHNESALRQSKAEAHDAYLEAETLRAAVAAGRLAMERSETVIQTFRRENEALLIELNVKDRIVSEQNNDIGRLNQDVANLAQDKEKVYLVSEALYKQIQALIQELSNEKLFVFSRRKALLRRAAQLKAAGIVDPKWYLSTYEDVAQAGIDPGKHYIEFGIKEGRLPSGVLQAIS